MNRKFYLSAIFVVVAVVGFPFAVQACAICLAGLGPNDPLTNAFNWSILFLMAMPYAIVGSIASWLFYRYRRTAGRNLGARKKAHRLPLAWLHREIGR